MTAHVTGEHIEQADGAMYELPLGTDVPAEVLRDALAQLIADAEDRGYRKGAVDALRGPHERAQAMAEEAVAAVRGYVVTAVRADPRMMSFAAELRRRGWRPPAGFSCGCNPAAGLCTSHAALRDAENAAVWG